MDTWEVVLILVLLTISISVIANREVPLSFISLLDNTYFQLAILGLTLGVAVVSPPVAIVGIATIVTIYYIRNLVKIQIVRANRREEQQERHDEQPRIEITEAVVTKTEIVANKDTIEAALKDHETKHPPQEEVGKRSSIGGSVPIDNHVTNQVEIPDPRGPQKNVESFDTHGNFHAVAPVGDDKKVLSPVDSDVFSPSSGKVDSSNEPTAISGPIRAFNDNSGQYDIQESRPQGSVERYDVFDFMPMKDMGVNTFEPIGVSIDDKVSNLKHGSLPSSAPPPDFNKVLPGKAH